ncbi:MAG: N-acyl homoserine lactone hydrolase, partial [Gammaproteobacteria bacterium]
MKHRIAALLSVSLFVLVLTGCNASSIATKTSTTGQNISLTDLESIINVPGPIEFDKHLAARWSISLSGLLNLEHPLAVQAGIVDRDEPIELYVYSLTHPAYGTYLVDSGISERFMSPDENTDLSFLVKIAMNTGKLQVMKTTRALVKESSSTINGVFLTHIHMDHIMGVADLPTDTAVFTGPGESSLN